MTDYDRTMNVYAFWAFCAVFGWSAALVLAGLRDLAMGHNVAAALACVLVFGFGVAFTSWAARVTYRMVVEDNAR